MKPKIFAHLCMRQIYIWYMGHHYIIYGYDVHSIIHSLLLWYVFFYISMIQQKIRILITFPNFILVSVSIVNSKEAYLKTLERLNISRSGLIPPKSIRYRNGFYVMFCFL